jgi:hypothetical protein
MHKIVNGEVVGLSAIEQEARSLEVSEGRVEALAQAKEHLVAEIDRRLDQIFRDARLHNDKKRIRLATSVEEAKAVFAAIRWPLAGSAPDTFVYRDDRGPSGGQVSREPVVVERVVEKQPIIERHENSYDDSWIRPQLGAIADQVADHNRQLFGYGQRLESLETRPPLLHIDPTTQPPIEVRQIRPLGIRDAMKRVEAIERQEEGLDPNDLPPIELDEPVPAPNEGLTSEELQKLDPVNPTFPDALALLNERDKIVELVLEQLTRVEFERSETKTQQKLDGPPPLYGQIRYELAMMAVNEKQEAMILLQEEAKLRGMAVLTLAHKIIEERQNLEKEVARYYALQHA